MTAEEKSHLAIDAKLTASGWTVQTKDRINLSAVPLTKQTRVVAEVGRRSSVVEPVPAANLQRATRLRQSILQ